MWKIINYIAIGVLILWGLQLLYSVYSIMSDRND